MSKSQKPANGQTKNKMTMSLETRATLKRFSTMLCSIGTIVAYSYLLGGAGGYLFGRGRPVIAALGFVTGTALAGIALRIWKSYLEDVALLEEQEKKDV